MVFDALTDSYNASDDGSPNNFESSCGIDVSFSPTQLLALAIRKRRRLIEDKERDIRRELLHTTVIQSLCKHLGENRAKSRQSKRRQRRRPMKRRWSDEVDDSPEQKVPSSDYSSSPQNTPSHHMGFDSALQSTGGHGHCQLRDEGNWPENNANLRPQQIKSRKMIGSTVNTFNCQYAEADKDDGYDNGYGNGCH